MICRLFLSIDSIGLNHYHQRGTLYARSLKSVHRCPFRGYPDTRQDVVRSTIEDITLVMNTHISCHSNETINPCMFKLFVKLRWEVLRGSAEVNHRGVRRSSVRGCDV